MCTKIGVLLSVLLLLSQSVLPFGREVHGMLILDSGRSSQGLTIPQTDYSTSSAGDGADEDVDDSGLPNTHLGSALVIGRGGFKRSNESYRLQLLPSSVNANPRRLRIATKSGKDLAALYMMYNNLKRARDEHIPCHFKLCHDDVEKRLSF